MPKFFVPALSKEVRCDGENFKHIVKSLRMKLNDKIVLCDGEGNDGEGFISHIDNDYLTVNIEKIQQSLSEPNTKISLFIAWPKGDKADLIVQKAVEIGVSSITFVMTEFCVSKPREADYSKKMSRLQKIALEASVQCTRGIIPSVKGIIPLGDAIEEMKRFDKAFLLYEGECEPLRQQLDEKIGTIALLTGAEGGFSKDEVKMCLNGKISPASLGKRILRCETAPLAAASALLFYFGDMD